MQAVQSLSLLEQPSQVDQARPLCVDLDGTLIATDTLWEGVLRLARARPWLLFGALLSMLGGRARFKRFVMSRTTLDPAALPYRQDLLEALRTASERGRTIVLATAADRTLADKIAEHLGLFAAVLASDGKVNLKASRKAAALKDAYGERGFDYIGDAYADLAIFGSAERAYLVNAGGGLRAAARRFSNVTLLSSRPSILKALLRQLRPHQWVKNALVVVPVLLAPGLPPPETLLRAAVAALAFSLCASAGYAINDLLDLDADRAHHTKHKRPFASGALPVLYGPPLIVGLVIASFTAALAFIPAHFTFVLGLYFIGTVVYSLYLKHVLLLDVLVLAGLYTHRILSGGVATGIPISAWLLGFSMFLFLSLAFAKRYVELAALESGEKIKSRNYYHSDLQMVGSMGAASGYLAGLVFSLYVEEGAQSVIYREPTVLWLVVPVLLYWVSRIWIFCARGQMHDDPVKFAIKDGVSVLCGGLIVSIALLARHPPHWLSVLLHG